MTLKEYLTKRGSQEYEYDWLNIHFSDRCSVCISFDEESSPTISGGVHYQNFHDGINEWISAIRSKLDSVESILTKYKDFLESLKPDQELSEEDIEKLKMFEKELLG